MKAIFSIINKQYTQKVVEIPIEMIKPCPYQPRDRITREKLEILKKSILENGLLQPVTATELDDGYYQLIAGHRRLLAMQEIDFKFVPTIVLDKTEQEIAVLNIIENIQREDLSFFEEAKAIKTLIEQLHLTQTQVGQKLSISQPAVANKLKLLNFDEATQQKIIENMLCERHARAVMRLPEKQQQKAIDYIIKHKLNVFKTDEYVNSLLTPKNKKKQNIIINIKDIRLFTNSINKAVKIMQTSGINTTVEQQDEEDFIYYKIKVPKMRNRRGELCSPAIK